MFTSKYNKMMLIIARGTSCVASLSILAVVFIALASQGFAQTVTTGDLTGTVTDATGAMIPTATVTLKSLDTGETRTTQTNEAAVFRFIFLKPGNYTISAASAGLVSDANKLAIEVGQVANITLIAKVQSVTQTIEVSEAAGLVNADNANLAATFNSRQIDSLPMPGGDLTTIAFTVPGINLSTGAAYGNFSSQGLPGTSNLFTINGADYDDPFLNLNNSGASNLLLGANEVEEATVVQNGYSVQYGRFAGAQLNYVTKHGNNAFHGDLVENWNGDTLNANDFFNNLNGVQRPRDDSNQYAALLSGPVVKNKLFFLMDTEGIRYVLPVTSVVTLPSVALEQYALANVAPSAVPLYQNAFNVWNAAPGVGRAETVTTGPGPLQDASGNLGCGPTFAGTPAIGGGIFGTNVSCAKAYQANGSNQNSEWLLTARGDYNISDKETLNVRYKHDTGFQPTGTNLLTPSLNLQSIQPEQEGQVNLTSIISPTMVNNLIASALYYSAIFGPANEATALATFPSDFNINDGGANGGGFYAMGDFWPIFPQGRNVGQAQFSDDFSWVKGNHNIKIGINYRHEKVSDHGLLEGTNGYYEFNSLADFANGVTNPNTGSLYAQNFTTLDVAHIRFYNYGIYAQDEWAIKSNLKLMFGIRLDRSGNPSCVDNCYNNLTAPFLSTGFNTANTSYDKVINTGLSQAYYGIDSIVPQPRVGLVWSPKHAHGMVIRTGMGMFADLSPGFLVASSYTNPPNPYTSVIFDGTPVGPLAASAALAQFNTFKSGFAGGATVSQLENTDPAFSPPNYFSIPQTLHTPEVIKWSFEIEQPFGAKNILIATYSGNHGYNLLTLNGFANAYDANTAQFPSFGSLPLAPRDAMFTSVTELTNNNVSNYDGLTVQFKRALGYGFSGQIGYTWSHALDDISNGGSGLPYNGANSLTAQVSPTASASYGNADYDIRNSVVADFVWDLPWKTSSKSVNYLVGGWTLASKLYFRSGTPFSIIDSQLAGDLGSNSINGTMLAQFKGGSLPSACGSGAVNTACFNSSSFVPSRSETNFGNLARNAIYGPHYDDVDMALYKKFALGERMHLQLGVTAADLFNHPNFAAPGHNVAVPGFGLITSTVGPPTSAYGSFQGAAVSGRVAVLNGKFVF
jgi:hypothetical protein